MKGTLGQVLELSGRGVVVCLEDQSGSVGAGERLIVGNKEWEIVSVGVPSGRKTRDQLQKGLPVTLAAELRDAERGEVVALIGQAFSTRMPDEVSTKP